MSYNTPDQFRQLSITSGSFDDVPDFVVQTALDVAANRIDSALRPHHSLPIPSGSVPSVVYDVERTLAAYWLWLSQGINPATGTDILQRRYEEVAGVPDRPDSGWLGMVAYGRITVLDDEDEDPTPVRQPAFVVGQPTRRWQQGRGLVVR